MEINLITVDRVVTPFLRIAGHSQVGDHRPGLLPGWQPPLLLVPARRPR